MKKKDSRTVGAAAGILSVLVLEVLERTGSLAGWHGLYRIALATALGWSVHMLVRRFSPSAGTIPSNDPILPE